MVYLIVTGVSACLIVLLFLKFYKEAKALQVERDQLRNRLSLKKFSPIKTQRLTYEGRTFLFTPPLYLEVFEEDGLFVTQDQNLGIHAYTQLREDLQAEVAEQVAVIMDNYVYEDPEKLAKGARDLQNTYRERVRELKKPEPPAPVTPPPPPPATSSAQPLFSENFPWHTSNRVWTFTINNKKVDPGSEEGKEALDSAKATLDEVQEQLNQTFKDLRGRM